MPDDRTTGTPTDGDALRQAYEDGRAAAIAGEEAAPGCTVGAAGKAWLQGYVDGAAERTARDATQAGDRV